MLFEQLVGHKMVFAADEYFLMADEPFPALNDYGNCDMHEDGIGMAQHSPLNSSTNQPQKLLPAEDSSHLWMSGN